MTVDRRRRLGDVLDEQPAGAQPAGVSKLGKGGRGEKTSADTDRRIQCAGHHHWDVDLFRDREQLGDPAQRRDLQHGDVGRPRSHDAQRVLGLADAFVGGDRHVDATAQLGQFPDRRARLLNILQSTELAYRFDSFGNRPSTVGVHPHRRHLLTDGVDACHVVGESLTRFGDLHLGGAGAREAGQHFGHVGGGDGRHRRVDRDAVAACQRGRCVGGLDAGGQPRRRLVRPVLQEGPEFAPARGAFDERQFANGDAAKPHPHRQGDDMQAIDEIGD